MENFIKNLPKAELHVHLLGTLEPDMLLHIAQRNGITVYDSPEQAHAAYRRFDSLETFVKAYDLAVSVVKTEEDFFELTFAYLQKAAQQSVLHSEFFIEVQNFELLGVSFDTIMNGVTSAILAAQKKYNITSAPVLCFLRQDDELAALHALKQATTYGKDIIACGLAGPEKDNSPSKFARVFTTAHELGYKICIHAGEDAGADYIWQAIRETHADRIDHGVRCMEDPTLVDYLIETQLPLTVCPLSNKLLNVFSAEKHPLKQLLEAGINASIHSDDPAFFQGYINENYAYAHHNMKLSKALLVQSARNSFRSSFTSEEQKAMMVEKLDRFVSIQ
jgi:adenine deaminase